MIICCKMYERVMLQALNVNRRSSPGLTDAELLLYTETFKYDGGTAMSHSPTATAPAATANTTVADSSSSSSSSNANSNNAAAAATAAGATTTAAAEAAAAVEEGRSSSIARTADAARHNSSSGGAGHQTECVICLCDFETGEQMRRLVSHLLLEYDTISH
jgi:hypothetical protein